MNKSSHKLSFICFFKNSPNISKPKERKQRKQRKQRKERKERKFNIL